MRVSRPSALIQGHVRVYHLGIKKGGGGGEHKQNNVSPNNVYDSRGDGGNLLFLVMGDESSGGRIALSKTSKVGVWGGSYSREKKSYSSIMQVYIKETKGLVKNFNLQRTA